MPTDTPEAIAAEVLPCEDREGCIAGAHWEGCPAFYRPAVADAIRREREARCQNHPAVNAQLCQECLDHAAETGAYL